MDDVLRYTTQRLPDIVEWIGQLVKLESPTNDKAAVDRAVEFVADRLSQGIRALRAHCPIQAG